MEHEYHFKLGDDMRLVDENGVGLSLGDYVLDCCGTRWLVCGADCIMTVENDKVLLSATLARNGAAGSIHKVATKRGAIAGYCKAWSRA